jgi:hypothetical protein
MWMHLRLPREALLWSGEHEPEVQNAILAKVSLDDFIGAEVPPPQLVKIDVEGGEYEVPSGGMKLFAKQRPLVIAEVHHQQAAEQITSWLSEYQYRAQWNVPKEQFPRHLFAWPKETDGEAWMRDSRSR